MVQRRAQTVAPTPAPECSSPKTRDDLADAISSALESTGSLVLCDRTKVKFSPSDDHIKVGKLNGGSEALSLSLSCEYGGSCVMNGDKDRTWRGKGGFMRVSGGAGVSFTGIKFTDFSASRDGGTFLLYGAEEATFTNCVFLDGTTDKCGGAVAIIGTRVTFNDCDFRRNDASEGGGVCAEEESEVKFISSDFRANSAIKTGGAVHASSSKISFEKRARFRSNTAGKMGGAGYFNDSTVEYQGPRIFWFRRNQAGECPDFDFDGDEDGCGDEMRRLSSSSQGDL